MECYTQGDELIRNESHIPPLLPGPTFRLRKKKATQRLFSWKPLKEVLELSLS